MSTPRRTLASLALLALAASPLLAGCGGTFEGSFGGGNGAEVDIGGTDLPADFPSTVPLIGGEVLRASSLGGDEGTVWNVSVRAEDATALDEIEVDLEDAGFDVRVQVAGDTGGTLVADGGDYSVIVGVAQDADGFVANYTVMAKSG